MFETIKHSNGVEEIRLTVDEDLLTNLQWAISHGYEGIVVKKQLDPLQVQTIYARLAKR